MTCSSGVTLRTHLVVDGLKGRGRGRTGPCLTFLEELNCVLVVAGGHPPTLPPPPRSGKQHISTNLWAFTLGPIRPD